MLLHLTWFDRNSSQRAVDTEQCILSCVQRVRFAICVANCGTDRLVEERVMSSVPTFYARSRNAPSLKLLQKMICLSNFNRRRTTREHTGTVTRHPAWHHHFERDLINERTSSVGLFTRQCAAASWIDLWIFHNGAGQGRGQQGARGACMYVCMYFIRQWTIQQRHCENSSRQDSQANWNWIRINLYLVLRWVQAVGRRRRMFTGLVEFLADSGTCTNATQHVLTMTGALPLTGSRAMSRSHAGFLHRRPPNLPCRLEL